MIEPPLSSRANVAWLRREFPRASQFARGMALTVWRGFLWLRKHRQ